MAEIDEPDPGESTASAREVSRFGRFDPPIPPREAIAEVRIRAPTRGNRRLERFLEAVNADSHVKALWHVSAVNASRLGSYSAAASARASPRTTA